MLSQSRRLCFTDFVRFPWILLSRTSVLEIENASGNEDDNDDDGDDDDDDVEG